MNAFNNLQNLYNEIEEIEMIKIEDLVPYKNHVFNLYEGNRLDEMIKNIQENGVIVPIIVRKLDNQKYEILSGHNRVNACKILKKELIKAIVKYDISDDEAESIMIDTNLMQRSFNDLSISEKSSVLAMKYKEIKKQGIRSDLEEVKKEEEYNSRGRLAEDFDLSESKVARLIAIDNLTEEYKKQLDNKKIKFNTALSLAKLDKKEQEEIKNYTEEYNVKLSKNLVDFIRENKEEFEIEEIIKSNIEDEKEETVSIKIPLEILWKKFPDARNKKELKTCAESIFYN